MGSPTFVAVSPLIAENLIHFPADTIEKSKNQNEVVPNSGIIDFDKCSANRTWDFIVKEILEYQEKKRKNVISLIK